MRPSTTSAVLAASSALCAADYAPINGPFYANRIWQKQLEYRPRCDVAYNTCMRQSPFDPPDFLSVPSTTSADAQAKTLRATPLALNQQVIQWDVRTVASFDNPTTNVTIFGTMGGPFGMASRQLEQQRFNVEALMIHQIAYVQPVVQATMQALPTMKPFMTLSDYDQLFQYGFPMPKQGTLAVTNDITFAYEATTISGAYIKRCKSLPAQFGVGLGGSELSDLLPAGVVSVQDAMDKGLIYTIDLSWADQLGTHNATAPLLTGRARTTKYTVGVVALFITHPNRLMPLAIWLGRSSRLVFTPKDTEVDWLAAKIYFQNTIKSVVNARHVLINHMLLEPQITAARRQLSEQHPVHILLAHSALLGFGIAEFVKDAFLTPNNLQPSALDQGLGIGAIGLQRVLAREYSLFDYQSMDPHKDFEIRNVKQLPNHHFMDDSLALFGSIERFVTRYLGLYYPTDADVANDYEIQAWASEVANPQQGRVKGFPSSIVTRSQLNRVVARFIWRNSVHHSADVGGFLGYDYMAHPGAFLNLLYSPPPSAKNVTSMQKLMEGFPSAEELIYKLAIVRNLNRNLRPDRSVLFAFQDVPVGPNGAMAVKRYQQEMQALSLQIRARAKQQEALGTIPGPAYALDPAQIPYWPWI